MLDIFHIFSFESRKNIRFFPLHKGVICLKGKASSIKAKSG